MTTVPLVGQLAVYHPKKQTNQKKKQITNNPQSMGTHNLHTVKLDSYAR